MSDDTPTPDPDRSWFQRHRSDLYLLASILLGALVGIGLVYAASPFLSNSVQANDVTLHAPAGPAATIATNTSMNLTQPFPDNHTVKVRSAAGNITLSSLNRTNATVTQITGAETRIAKLDASRANLTINPGDKRLVIVGGDIERLHWRRSMELDDWTEDFYYGGNAGESLVVLTGLPQKRKVKVLDAHTRLRLGDDETSAAGIGVFRLPNSNHSAVLRPATYVSSNASLPRYYANQTPVGNQSAYVPDDASLDTLGGLLNRVTSLVVGFGSPIPGGDTYAGVIVTGLVMAGAFLGAVGLTGVGAPGGAVVAAVTGYGLVEAGLAPGWLRIVLLLIIGTAAAVATLRITQ